MDTLVEAAVRASVIAAVAAVGLRLFRITAPAVSHAVWTGVTIVMLLMPAVVMWGPRAPVPVLAPVNAATAPVDRAGGALEVSSVIAPPIPGRTESSTPDWVVLALVIYALGAGWLLARLAAGLWHVRRLMRTAALVRGRLTHALCATPVTIGVMRPRILLPCGWEKWAPEQLAAILAHESAHVKRRDPLVLLLTLLNRAVFWFHPLAWWMHREVAALAEQAADEAVLDGGHDRQRYAELLVTFARAATVAGRRVSLGTQMPGPGMATRLRRIAAGGSSPRPSCGRVIALAAATCGAALVCAMATPTHAAAEPAAAVQRNPSWQMRPTEHFDVYYQPDTAAAVDDVGGRAEQAYTQISRDLKHDVAERIPLILVALDRSAPTDDAQALTLITAAGAPRAGDHIILPIEGLRRGTVHPVHELTHHFLFDIMRDSALAFPWFSEGMAEHERGAWDTRDLEQVRTAARQGRVPAVEALSATDRAWGHAVVDFIAASFGDDGLRRYIFSLRVKPGQLDAAAGALGVSLPDFDAGFVEYTTATFGR